MQWMLYGFTFQSKISWTFNRIRPHGILYFIEGRLLDDSFNEAAKKAVNRFCQNLKNFKVLDFASGLGQLTPFLYECDAKEVIFT